MERETKMERMAARRQDAERGGSRGGISCLSLVPREAEEPPPTEGGRLDDGSARGGPVASRTVAIGVDRLNHLGRLRERDRVPHLPQRAPQLLRVDAGESRRLDGRRRVDPARRERLGGGSWERREQGPEASAAVGRASSRRGGRAATTMPHCY